MRCLLKCAAGQVRLLRIFRSLEVAEDALERGAEATEKNSALVPAEAGLRLAVFLEQRWLPAEVATSWEGNNSDLSVRVFVAGEAHGGRLLDLPQGTLLSLDYLEAEKLELSQAGQLCGQRGPVFYQGSVLLPHAEGPLVLSRDSVLELTEGRHSERWRVLDLLPDTAQLVLVDMDELNNLSRNRQWKLTAAELNRLQPKLIEQPTLRYAYEPRSARWLSYLRAPRVWAKQMLSNTKGIFTVLDMILFRPVQGGLIPENHPWTTGLDPRTGKTVWSDNIIFATDPKTDWNCPARYVPDSDEEIVRKVGLYLAGMVKKTVSTLEHPFGTRARMPAAIGYIHGAVHYNSGIIIFNDYAEGIYHLSDPRFISEMQRFARESKREIMIMFRERVYEPKAYAYFAGMIRTVLPWFSNTNGPIRPSTDPVNDQFLVGGKVMWGNPAPYPVVNPITGNWIEFVREVAHAAEDKSALERICLPPVGRNTYFQEQYQGNRQQARRHERWLAIGTAARVRARGDNLFFVSESDLEKEKTLAHQSKPKYVNANGGNDWPVVIIGAGPAGLSVAQELKQRGINALILEQSDSVGSSWRRMPAERQLVSIWALSELANTPKEIRPTERFVSFDRFAKYLENYARHHQLAIATNAQVIRTRALPCQKGFAVSLADGTEILAADLVNATGYACNPFTPEIDGAVSSAIPSLHSAHYKNPAQVAGLAGGRGKRVLIVGKGLSAGQAMLELAKTGFAVTLSVRGQVQFGPTQRASAFRQKLLPMFDRMASAFGRDSGTAPFIPMEGGASAKLVASNAVALKPGITRFEQNKVLFNDGKQESFDFVLYCTGYRYEASHLSGLIAKAGNSGFHSIGIDGGRTSRSRFLRGIREDAVFLAERICKREKSA